ncbi:MAG: cellulase family glycosylhydrolase [Paludibacteraceae bacterium]|nr:cellulase family glycosylhydrolase [Paludibacteraceae bacterium]
MRKIFTLLAAAFTCLQAFAFNYSNESECSNNKYVDTWGKLKLVGNQLCSESGEPVQLRGWSTHGRQWNGSLYDSKDFLTNQKKTGANIARIAMYVEEGGWKDPDWIKNCIRWTAELNMYCLIDWHVLTPGTPTSYLSKDPQGFFKDIAQFAQQNGYKHVLYELCNEPNENTDGDIYRPALWKDIKDYSNKILPEINNVDPNAVVIIGTPQWDQALVHAVEDPIKGYPTLNIMYSFHSYVGNQTQYFGELMTAAKFIPIFVTEWGTTENKGQSMYSEDNAKTFLNICNGNNRGNVTISWCNWSWSTEGGMSGGLSGNGFSQSGTFICNQLHKGDQTPTMEGATTPYELQKISDNGDSFILMDFYDNGGEGNAYHESDDAQWQKDAYANNHCNAGLGSSDARMKPGYHNNDCVDVNRISNETDTCNIGYILSGEWVKFTIDVEKAGYYELSAFANAHDSKNRISFMVDNENIIRDLNDKENTEVSVIYLQPNGTPSSSGGYGDWGYSKFRSDFDGKNGQANYGLYFKNSGVQTLLVTFMTECAGLGPLRLSAVSTVSVDEVENELANSTVTSKEGDIIINMNNAKDYNAKVNIYSASGLNMYNGVLNQNSTTIGEFEDGIYFVTIDINGSIVREKVIVY